MDELWRQDATRLAALVRDRTVSSREVVQAHLDRVEDVDAGVNAVVRVLRDEALAAADAADAVVAAGQHADGRPPGPLHGVPVTVKENIDVAGSPTTLGLPLFAERVAPRDAPLVAGLRAFGAIPFARTNMPDLGLRVNTVSTLHGATRNPRDPRRTAGGSSGGDAAALATGMTPIGTGNDLGGSLRNPAHACGVASVKPSTGVVPSASSLPGPAPALSSQQFAVEGVLARSVADVTLAFHAARSWPGARDRDPLLVPLPPVRAGDAAPCRVALLAEPPGGGTHPGVAAAVRDAGAVLAAAGHEVVEAVPPAYEEAVELWRGILAADLRMDWPAIRRVVGEEAREILGWSVDGMPRLEGEAYQRAQRRRHELLLAWHAFHVEHPVLLQPVWTEPAFALDADTTRPGATEVARLGRPVLSANLFGAPVATVPVALVDGLPVAVQLQGPRLADLHCLRVAATLEAGSDFDRSPVDPVPG